MPGGPGWFPTRGSHRPVRARISAYGSSDLGFAVWLRHTPAARQRQASLSTVVSLRRCSNFQAFAVFPFNGSLIRRPAFLHGVQGGSCSPASQVLSGRYESCRPSRRASFPSLGGTTLLPVFAPRRPGEPGRQARGFAVRQPRCTDLSVETTGFPGSWGNPNACLLMFLDPGGLAADRY